jgi:predicted AlkP superfamily phosphohydrolase/phosphomutase
VREHEGSARRVLLIGLDCVPPKLAFERYRQAMPNLSRLMRSGCFGPLRSTFPPITVPAWASMLSGWDPGELGLYGFRNRVPGSHELRLASSEDLSRPMLWDRAGAHGKKVSLLFVPPSYPPRPVNGELVSCFLTPDADCPHTYPAELAQELRERFGPYLPDVEDYRSGELQRLLADIFALSAQRFAIAEHVLRTRRSDFTALVDIGPDRFHHAFWSHIDPDDPRHEPGNPYAREGERYYAFLDEQIGRLLAAAGEDSNVLVVSDHGARPLRGGICINEWLIERGYLVLQRYPDRPTPFSELAIDWRRTRAWGEGGYYARIALNLRGRDPEGCVDPNEAAALSEELKRELLRLPGPDGEALAHRVVRPAEVYRELRGSPPDLMVFFDDLGYRALGSVGSRGCYSPVNDTGADGCNHAWDGIFVAAGPDIAARGALSAIACEDVAATLYHLLDVPAPHDHGRDRSRA